MTPPAWLTTIDVALVCLTLLALLCAAGAIGWYRAHRQLDDLQEPWCEPRPYPRTRVTPQVHEPSRPALYDQDAAP